MRNEFRICFFSLNLDSEIYCKSKCCDFVNIFLCDLIECRLRKHIVFAVKCNCLIFKSARVGALSAREKCPNSNCCMFISSIAFTWMVRRSWIFFLKLSVHYAQYKRCANVVRTRTSMKYTITQYLRISNPCVMSPVGSVVNTYSCSLATNFRIHPVIPSATGSRFANPVILPVPPRKTGSRNVMREKSPCVNWINTSNK